MAESGNQANNQTDHQANTQANNQVRNRWQSIWPVLLVLVLGVTLSLAGFWQVRENQFNRIGAEIHAATQSMPAYLYEPRFERLADDGIDQLIAARTKLVDGKPVAATLDDARRWSGWDISDHVFVNLEYYVHEQNGFRLDYEASNQSSVAPRRSFQADNPLQTMVIERVAQSGDFGCFGHLPLDSANMVARCYLPVYRDERSFISDQQRSNNVAGLLAAVLHARVGETSDSLRIGIRGINFAVYGDDLPFNTADLPAALAENLDRGMLHHALDNSQGFPFRLIVVPSDGFVGQNDTLLHWVVLSLGFLLTLMTALLVYRSRVKSEQVMNLVQQQTEQLQQRTNALMSLNRDLAAQNLEKERAQEALRQSELRYRLIAENADDVIYTHTFDGRWIYVSPSVIKQRGLSPEEFASLSLEQTMNSASMSAYDHAMNRLKSESYDGSAIVLEITAIHTSGYDIHLDIQMSPFVDEHNTVIGVLGVSRDVTEKKVMAMEKEDLEQEVRHAQKMEAIGTLAGGVAHDFNNLLTAILGYTELIKLDGEVDKESRYNLDVIEKAGLRAQQLTGQLLGFARKGNYQSVKVDINEIVNETAEFLRSTIDRKIALEVNLSKLPVPVLGDPGQIGQVLLNLGINARDAMKSGGTLKFSTFVQRASATILSRHPDLVDGLFVVIEVQDSGVGIHADLLEKIFDPYYTDKEAGSGMGLAMVYGVTVSHGGAIEVESEPGIGSLFRIYLPLGAEDDSEIVPDETAQESRPELSVLLVDDEAMVREMAGQMLGSLGYTATPCGGGNEAIEVAGKAPNFDLAIVDMIMPDMGGWECVQGLRAIQPDLPVILCTGYSRDRVAELLNNHPHLGFLAKPFRRHDLNQAVHSLMQDASGEALRDTGDKMT